jgi:putative FmdB family regulatory protein
MPIYEYKCADCGHHLETIQKFSDDPLTDCPDCKRPSLKRLISAAGFQLKGTGWYATDFKSNGKKEQKKDAPKETTSDSASAAPEKKAAACGGGCGCH